MTSILTEQKRLLAEKIRVLERLGEGLQWSLERLPALNAENVHDPAVTERTVAIVERFCKLQDQLAGPWAMHTPCWEKSGAAFRMW